MIIGNVLPMTSAGAPAATAHPEQERQLAAQAGLSVRSTEPLNCETPAHLLGEDVTPSARFFRRNHFPIPVLDPDAWRLRIGGLVRQPLSLSLHELTPAAGADRRDHPGVRRERPDLVQAAG